MCINRCNVLILNLVSWEGSIFEAPEIRTTSKTSKMHFQKNCQGKKYRINSDVLCSTQKSTLGCGDLKWNVILSTKFSLFVKVMKVFVKWKYTSNLISLKRNYTLFMFQYCEKYLMFSFCWKGFLDHFEMRNWYKDLPTSLLLHAIQYQKCKKRLALLAR